MSWVGYNGDAGQPSKAQQQTCRVRSGMKCQRTRTTPSISPITLLPERDKRERAESKKGRLVHLYRVERHDRPEVVSEGTSTA
ncbi:hypothetical protein AC578_1281 [Pseudocercospora eumusae]|uniref:Uncharacterized protein n=1 Tax=Pseudocercospora eumusae TaxID=321146 RepID=A0A139HUA1_9PEZI|nr:hypothetical protein AC578_1281 [Pseudocercospora eumusae]